MQVKTKAVAGAAAFCVLLPMLCACGSIADRDGAHPAVDLGAVSYSSRFFPAMAQRTGGAGCWARFGLDENDSLCIPREIWVLGFSPIGEWTGKWKARSPLELEASGGSAGEKQVRYSWQARTRNVDPQKVRSWKGSWDASVQGLVSRIERRREELSQWLKESCSDKMGVFRLLLVGESSSETQIFREIGFVHLLSATGIHLVLLAAWIGSALTLVLRLLPIPVPIALAFRNLLVGIAWIYCWLLSGARAGMLRPVFLLAVRALARAAGFRWARGAPFLIALGLDFLLGAFLRFRGHESMFGIWNDPGRAFYVCAVGGALLSGYHDGRKRSRIRLAIASWLSASVYGLFTLRLLPLAGILLSILTLPWIAGVIYPLLVFKAAGIPIPAIPVEWVLKLTENLLEFLIRWELRLPSIWLIPPEAVLIAAIAATFAWALPKTRRLRWSVAIALLVATAACMPARRLLLPTRPASRASSNEPPLLGAASEVEQLDVGQGDAALVIERDAGGFELVGLIDTGSERAVSETQWLRLFSDLGIRKIDWIALTHLDEDHSGGTLRLSELIPIACATTSAAELDSPRGQRWKSTMEERGIPVTARLDGCIPYPALEPAPAARGRSRAGAASANENMSAFLIPLRGGGFFLSAGDATARDEPRIGAWAEKIARTLPPGPRILKLSHHGSKTSSNAEFLREVAPTQAWISDGVGNSYGHPSPLVLERVKELGLPIRRTDLEGTIKVYGETGTGQ